MTSYFSERTAEYSILLPVVAYFASRFGSAAPIYYWATREGNTVARDLHAGRRLRVLAVFARRPKLGPDGMVLGKLNTDLFEFAWEARRQGIPTVAGFPVVKDIFGLGGDVPIQWFPLDQQGDEEIRFQVNLSVPTEPPQQLGGSALRTLTLEEVGDLVQQSPVLCWKDAMTVIGKARKKRRFPFGGAFFGTGMGYTPAYVLVPD